MEHGKSFADSAHEDEEKQEIEHIVSGTSSGGDDGAAEIVKKTHNSTSSSPEQGAATTKSEKDDHDEALRKRINVRLTGEEKLSKHDTRGHVNGGSEALSSSAESRVGGDPKSIQPSAPFSNASAPAKGMKSPPTDQPEKSRVSSGPNDDSREKARYWGPATKPGAYSVSQTASEPQAPRIASPSTSQPERARFGAPARKPSNSVEMGGLATVKSEKSSPASSPNNSEVKVRPGERAVKPGAFSVSSTSSSSSIQEPSSATSFPQKSRYSASATKPGAVSVEEPDAPRIIPPSTSHLKKTRYMVAPATKPGAVSVKEPDALRTDPPSISRQEKTRNRASATKPGAVSVGEPDAPCIASPSTARSEKSQHMTPAVKPGAVSVNHLTSPVEPTATVTSYPQPPQSSTGKGARYASFPASKPGAVSVPGNGVADEPPSVATTTDDSVRNSSLANKLAQETSPGDGFRETDSTTLGAEEPPQVASSPRRAQPQKARYTAPATRPGAVAVAPENSVAEGDEDTENFKSMNLTDMKKPIRHRYASAPAAVEPYGYSADAMGTDKDKPDGRNLAKPAIGLRHNSEPSASSNTSRSVSDKTRFNVPASAMPGVTYVTGGTVDGVEGESGIQTEANQTLGLPDQSDTHPTLENQLSSAIITAFDEKERTRTAPATVPGAEYAYSDFYEDKKDKQPDGSSDVESMGNKAALSRGNSVANRGDIVSRGPMNDNGHEELLISAVVVDEDQLAAEMMAKMNTEAVSAELLDLEGEDRKRRKQMAFLVCLIGFMLVIAVAVVVPVVVTQNDSVASKASLTTSLAPTVSPAPSLAPSFAPSFLPTAVPSTSPSFFRKNDLCDEARVIEANSERQFGDLLNATRDEDIPCSLVPLLEINGIDDDLVEFDDDIVLSRLPKGRWYSFIGNGLYTTIDMCVNSGEVRAPAIVKGSCGNLKCEEERSFHETVFDWGAQECRIRDRFTFLSDLDVPYFVYVYTLQPEIGVEASFYDFSLSSTDQCETPVEITRNTTREFTFSLDTSRAVSSDKPSCDTATSGSSPGIWFKMTGSGVRVELSTCETTGFDSQISVFQGDCEDLQCVTGNNDYCDLQSKVSFNAEIGVDYSVVVHGNGDARGSFILSGYYSAFNAKCETAVSLNPDLSSVEGSNLLGGRFPFSEIDTEFLCGSFFSVDREDTVWYKIEGVEGKFFASTCDEGTTFDTRLAVFEQTGDSCEFAKCMGTNDDQSSCAGINFCYCEVDGFHSRVDWVAEKDKIYLIAVHGYTGDQGDFTLNYGPVSDPPASEPIVGPPTPSPTRSGCSAQVSEVFCEPYDCYSLEYTPYQYNPDITYGMIGFGIEIENFGSSINISEIFVTSDFMRDMDVIENLSDKVLTSDSYQDVFIGRVPLDLTRERYSGTVEVKAYLDSGEPCDFDYTFDYPVVTTPWVYTDDDFYWSSNGPSISPSSPLNGTQSESPSVSPSSSAQPSTLPSESPTQSVCTVEAQIECTARGIGPDDPRSCELLPVPNFERCGGNSRKATESIAMQYNGKRCDESTTRGRNNACFDRDGQDQMPEFVWISMTNDFNAVMHDQVVRRDEILFVFVYGEASQIFVEIFEVRQEGSVSSRGSLLQRLQYGLTCLESDALVMLDQIGGLRVVAIETYGAIHAAYDIGQKFSITNVGNVPMTIENVVTTSTIFPEIDSLSYESVLGSVLMPGESRVVHETKRRLFVFEEVVNVLESTIEVSGTSPFSPELCEATANTTTVLA